MTERMKLLDSMAAAPTDESGEPPSIATVTELPVTDAVTA